VAARARWSSQPPEPSLSMAAPSPADAELINFIESLAPSAKLTTREACAFLRVSQATLERWRASGCGPEYIQGGGPGARGTNQAVRYRKQALIEWEALHTVKSCMQAAIRKGQMQGRPGLSAPCRSPIMRKTFGGKRRYCESCRIRRIQSAFGIGVVELDLAVPQKSQVLFPAKVKDSIDWDGANKLAKKIPTSASS